MTDKKIEEVIQRLDRIEKALEKLVTENLTTGNKTFLTLEMAKEITSSWHEYKEGVYYYAIDERYTLIEDGKVLIKGAGDVEWYSLGHYEYIIGDNTFEVKDGVTTKRKVWESFD